MTMENDIKKIFDDAKKLALTADEKAAGREMLRAYMALRPVRVARQGAAKKPFGFAFLVPLVKPASVFALVLALMVSAGGVSYAAEAALPGDVLYPVKVAVNEEVRAAATVGAEEKAKWETERAERRLAEAEALAAKGRLKAKAVAAVEKGFAKHAEKAKEHFAEAEKEEEERDGDDGDVAEADAEFEGALNAHQEILSMLASAKADTGARSSRLAEKVGAEAKAAVERREKKEDKLRVKAQADVRAAAEARGRNARAAVVEARAQFDAASGRMEADAAANAEARLAAAEKELADGDTELAVENFSGAFSLYLQAHRDAQEARRLVKAAATFRVRVELRAGRRERQDGDRRKDQEKKQEEGEKNGGAVTADDDEKDAPDDRDDEPSEDGGRGDDGRNGGGFFRTDVRTDGSLRVRF